VAPRIVLPASCQLVAKEAGVPVQVPGEQLSFRPGSGVPLMLGVVRLFRGSDLCFGPAVQGGEERHWRG
jgi:hypothetical protein